MSAGRVLNAVKKAAKHCTLDPETLAELAALGIKLAVLVLLLTLAPESLIALLPALGAA